MTGDETSAVDRGIPGEQVPGEQVPGEQVPGEQVPGERGPGERGPGERPARDVEEPAEFRAGHLGRNFDRFRAVCRDRVTPAGLHHLAYYNADGICGFAHDVFQHPALERFIVPGLDLERQRRTYRTTGRQIVFKVRELSRRLADLDSGELIRTVFDSGDGAFVYNRVRSGEHLIGATLDRAAIDLADRAMAALTNDLLGLRDLPAADAGGFTRSGRVPTADTDHVHDPAVTGPGADDPGADRVVAELRAVVRPWDLHYAGLFAHGDWRLAVDVLADEHLAHHFHDITAARRRELYAEIGQALITETERIGYSLRTMIGGELVRIVLDVEEGALYFVRLGPDHCLLGVTLSQARVADADHRFTDLCGRVRSRVAPGAMTT